MKNIKELSDRELLEEILRSERKNALSEKISAAANTTVAVVIIIIALVLVPHTSMTLSNVNRLVEDTNRVIIQAEASLQDIDRMVKSVNELVEENTENLNSAIQKISAIDIDSLNDSIRELGNIIEPLSGFFSVLGR